MSNSSIPGTINVIRIHGGAAFYCTVHKKEIQPLLLEVGENEVPACEDCFLDMLIANGQDIQEVEETGDPISEAIGDHSINEEDDVAWAFECYT